MARPERYLVELDYRGVPLDVAGFYYCGSRGDYYNPPEPAMFEVETIAIHGDIGVDLVNLLDGLGYVDRNSVIVNVLEEIEYLCTEKIKQGDEW